MTISNRFACRLYLLIVALGLMLGAHTAQAQTVIYYHTDALGSPVAVTDAGRVVIERSEYEPYGKLLNRPLADGPGYTGHVSDAATGLSYMQQRYCDPTIGRCLSVDPVTAYDSGDMRFFNRYAYAFNNPYRFTDPDGRKPDDEWFTNVDPMGNPGGGNELAGVSITTSVAAVGVVMAGAAAPAAISAAATNPATANTVAAGIIEAGGGEALGGASLAAGAGAIAAQAARGGENAAAAAGRAAHKVLGERVAAKVGWKSEPRMVGADGKVYKPDVVTPGGRILELKPNTASGRAAGAAQAANYEKQLGMPARVIYYDPADYLTP
jgi:RHS repeat-associated protein